MFKSILEGFGWTLGALVCLGLTYGFYVLPRKFKELIIINVFIVLLVCLYLNAIK